MTIQIPCAEAKIWADKANEIIRDAMSSARNIPSDPLLSANRRVRQLSSFVSEIDGIKKRHGRLLSQALIFAIEKTPGWRAHRGNLSVVKGKSALGCLAFKFSTGKLCVFDCRRGHGSFDKDTRKATDARLQLIESNINSYAEQRFGWPVKSKKSFILSLYGNTWPSSYPIYCEKDISNQFAPCIGTFMRVYMRYVEYKVANNYSQKFFRAGVSIRSNVFSRIKNDPALSSKDVIFSASGARIV